MANLGPLTTTFTPGAGCSHSTGLYAMISCGTTCEWWVEGPLSLAIPNCFPARYTQFLSHYYSPGICPSGYTVACTSTNEAASVSETVQTCCPTALGYDYGCVTPHNEYPWQYSLACTVSLQPGVSMYTFPDITYMHGTDTVVSSTTRAEAGIGAYGVEIRFQATDFIATSTTGSTSANRPTETPPSTSNVIPSTTTSTPDGQGLSTPAAIGTGVGVAIVGLLLFGLGLFFGRKSMRARKAATTLSGPGQKQGASLYQQSPQAGVELNTQRRPQELCAEQTRPELDSGAPAQELHARHARQEMPASTRQ
ncbi:hypothetical protein K461DRAFT_271218 [Myriangium duriaei CBS 260.36]|uniref:Uncharacterized protein n=1 Tax=Myriangium duriaei CBS 260.36 TaxID=1168546 RepID=A0A9P4ME72_9PEZI|nr:hypothetical protein K461DRAFT_271218 [Myriangium duriaei CBS 260.36]